MCKICFCTCWFSFGVLTPCESGVCCQCFGETCWLHFLGWRLEDFGYRGVHLMWVWKNLCWKYELSWMLCCVTGWTVCNGLKDHNGSSSGSSIVSSNCTFIMLILTLEMEAVCSFEGHQHQHPATNWTLSVTCLCTSHIDAWLLFLFLYLHVTFRVSI